LDDSFHFVHNEHIANWVSLVQKLAHEIKNPLTSAGLALNRLGKKIKLSDESVVTRYQRYFRFIHEDFERMRNTVNELLHFTSSLDYQFTQVNLNILLTGLVKSVGVLPGERIKIMLNLDHDLPIIQIDEAQVSNALKNILHNALDAIQDSGCIRIYSSVIEKFDNKTGEVGSYVDIEISDDGTGIPPENLPKIYEPNFTTKNTGSGFGLTIAKQVIEDHGGHIEIQSKPQVGTLVRVLFPITS
jgi:nitrogen fixation/metabolism regulation signal transduction histidine kinase